MSKMEIFINNVKSSLTLEHLPESFENFKNSLINLFDFPNDANPALYFLDEDNEKVDLSNLDDYESFKHEQNHIIYIEIDAEKLVKKHDIDEFQEFPIVFDNDINLKGLEPKIKAIVLKHFKEMVPIICKRVEKLYEMKNQKPVIIAEECQTDFNDEKPSIIIEQQESHKKIIEKLKEEEKKQEKNVNKIEKNIVDYSIIDHKEQPINVKSIEIEPKLITAQEPFIIAIIILENPNEKPIPSGKYTVKVAEKFCLVGETMKIDYFSPKEKKIVKLKINNPLAEGPYGGFFELLLTENMKVLNTFPFEFEVKEENSAKINKAIQYDKETVRKADEMQNVLMASKEEYEKFLIFFNINKEISINDVILRYYEGNL